MVKKSAKKQEPMRTLIIDNGSEYLNKIEDHVSTAAEEQSVKQEVVRLSVDELQEAYNKGDASVVQGFDYVISSGSPKYRKGDTKLHEFVADNVDQDATFLGVCHGAQQYAKAHGAGLKKTNYMHHGKRRSEVKSDDPALEGAASEGTMENYGHHKWIIPSDEVGSELEVIAESESPRTKEKFVEMYKVKGRDHYGVQFHPEKGDGRVIKNLFRSALAKKESTGQKNYNGPVEYKKAA